MHLVFIINIASLGLEYLLSLDSELEIVPESLPIVLSTNPELGLVTELITESILSFTFPLPLLNR